MTNSIPCPHCGDQNSSAGAFCQSCGKALPSAIPQGPRVVGGKDFASTAAGQQLQVQELHRQVMRASNRFISIGVILMILGGMLYAQTLNLPPSAQSRLQSYALVDAILGAALLATGFWARFNAVPATITGLVLYCLRTAYFVYIGLTLNNLGENFYYLAIRGYFIFVLFGAVGAALKARKLQEALASNVPMAGRAE